jgi:hypothetical protein
MDVSPKNLRFLNPKDLRPCMRYGVVTGNCGDSWQSQGSRSLHRAKHSHGQNQVSLKQCQCLQDPPPNMAGQSSLLYPIICQKPVIVSIGQLRAKLYAVSDCKHAIIGSEGSCPMLKAECALSYLYLATVCMIAVSNNSKDAMHVGTYSNFMLILSLPVPQQCVILLYICCLQCSCHIGFAGMPWLRQLMS